MIRIYGYSKKNKHEIEWNSFVFPGGEIQVQLDVETEYPKFHVIVFEAKLNSPADILTLAFLEDAVASNKISNTAKLSLKLGYLPYARQDRVCSIGQAESSRVMAGLINSMSFDEVIVLDPHSKASIYWLDAVEIRTQASMIGQATELQRGILSRDKVVVAPDAGSTSKVRALVGGLPYVQGSKIRDPKTGKLSGFSYEGDVKGKDLLIVDDICDGGGTFIGLTKELLAGGANSVELYVSHGIFSKGIDMLYDNGINHIYTTNTIDHGYEDTNWFTNLYWS